MSHSSSSVAQKRRPRARAAARERGERARPSARQRDAPDDAPVGPAQGLGLGHAADLAERDRERDGHAGPPLVGDVVVLQVAVADGHGGLRQPDDAHGPDDAPGGVADGRSTARARAGRRRRGRSATARVSGGGPGARGNAMPAHATSAPRRETTSTDVDAGTSRSARAASAPASASVSPRVSVSLRASARRTAASSAARCRVAVHPVEDADRGPRGRRRRRRRGPARRGPARRPAARARASTPPRRPSSTASTSAPQSRTETGRNTADGEAGRQDRHRGPHLRPPVRSAADEARPSARSPRMSGCRSTRIDASSQPLAGGAVQHADGQRGAAVLRPVAADGRTALVARRALGKRDALGRVAAEKVAQDVRGLRAAVRAALPEEDHLDARGRAVQHGIGVARTQACLDPRDLVVVRAGRPRRRPRTARTGTRRGGAATGSERSCGGRRGAGRKPAKGRPWRVGGPMAGRVSSACR